MFFATLKDRYEVVDRCTAQLYGNWGEPNVN
jgi:hypothetical protein